MQKRSSIKGLVRMLVSVGLIIAICFQMIASPSRAVYVLDSIGEKEVYHFTDENGASLEVVFQKDDPEMNTFTLEVKNLDTGVRTVSRYSNGILVQNEYTTTGAEYVLTGKREYDVANKVREAQEAAVSSAGYKSAVRILGWDYKTSDGKKYRHYYQVGNSGEDLGYTIIGCVRGYRLNNEAKFLEDFESHVRKSNNYWLSALGSDLLTGASAVGMIVALVLGGAPAWLIAGLVGGESSGAIAVVTCFIKSHQEYKLADEYFDKAKANGVRIY